MKRFWLSGSVAVGMLFALIPAPPSIAQWRAGGQWIDSSGDLVVTVMDRWGRSCARGTAQASYRVAGGSGGLLQPDDCDDNSGISRFEDTSGSERCVGSLVWNRGSSGPSNIRDTIWTIEAPVPGFPCSTVGQIYNIRLYYSEPPPAMTRSLEPSMSDQRSGWLKENSNASHLNLLTGTYSRVSNFISIHRHEDRFCYVGTSRNGRLVASLSEHSEQSNTYYFDGSNDGRSLIFQIDEQTLGYGNTEYQREAETLPFNQLPFDLKSCLSSTEAYYESDEPPRR